MNAQEEVVKNGKPDGNHHKEVKIHIDKKLYTSPNPTTGAALYRLGSIDPGKYDLWLEVHGPGDDELIPNNDTELFLKNGSHFCSTQKNLNPGA